MKPKTMKRKQLSDVSVDEFMSSGFEPQNSPSQAEDLYSNKKKRLTKRRSRQNVESDSEKDDSIPVSVKKTKKKVVSSHKKEINQDQTDSDSELEQPVQHKAALSRLRKSDPEFFKYLSENDKDLLNFEISDDDSDNSTKQETFHKPSSKLQVASDESDFSVDEETLIEKDNSKEESSNGIIKVTTTLIDSWRKQLETNPDLEVVRNVILAFQSAVDHAGDSKLEAKTFVVEGNTAFNGVVKLSLVNLLPAIHKILKLPEPAITQKQGKLIDPTKSKMWTKMISPLKTYLNYVIKMLSEVFEADLLILLLRHILYLVPFYIPFVKHSRVLLKKLVNFWSTSEESVRVLAFVGIIRLSRTLPKEYLDYILKQMYLSYVRNSKFTSPSTWPLINFMKRSLVELYCLDFSLAYQQAFVYIRQLAIHLRNALTIKKKDSFQAVYNWQYVHCLLLWSHLLGTANHSQQLKPLIYPLTQVVLGTIKLIPTAKYYPLRFQLIQSLIKLCRDTKTFIPVLPLLLETLDQIDFSKKSLSLSMKPVDFSCALKLSKSQLCESGFKDTCIEKFYELSMDYLNVYAHIIGFPELVLPTTVQIKGFLKKCKIANYCRKVKQLLDKIEENNVFIESKRKNVSFEISDFDKVDEWENSLKGETPLNKFYNSWRLIKDRDILHNIAMKDHVKVRDEQLPTIKRKPIEEQKAKDRQNFQELFADSEDSDGGINFGVLSDDE